ncbi:MAG: tetratricopeptide repeat protein [Planctomycetota bacterium]
MDTDSHGYEEEEKPEAERPRAPRPPYRRIAVMGVIAAGLTVVGGLRLQSYLIEANGMGPGAPSTSEDVLLGRAQEFLRCAWNARPSDPDRAGCARIARKLAMEATCANPRFAEAHLHAALAAELGDMPEDVVLAHLEDAIAAEPGMHDAHLVRLRILLPMFLDRWCVTDGGLFVEREAARDSEMARLRHEIRWSLCAIGPFEPSLDREYSSSDLKKILEGSTALPSGGSMVAWTRRLIRIGFSSPTSLRTVTKLQSARVTQMLSPKTWETTTLHASIQSWEVNWWLSRWPTYGRDLLPEPTMSDRSKQGARSTCAGSPWWRKGGEEALLQLAARTPCRGLALAREAEALEAQGSFLEALNRADQAVALLKSAPGVRLLRARIHEDLFDLESAQADYDAAVRLARDRPEYLRVRASFLLQTGRLDEALEDAGDAAQLDLSAVSVALLGDVLVAGGRAAEALTVLVGADPSIAGARCRALRALGRIEEASALAAEVDDPIEAALCALGRGDLQEASRRLSIPLSEVTLDYAWREDPSLTDVYPHLDRTALLDARGLVLLALGRHAKALQALDEVVFLQPMRAEAHALRARALFELKHVAQANAASLRALKVDPHCALAWKVRGRALEADGRLEEAEQAFGKAVSLDPNDLEARARQYEIGARGRR